MKTTIACPICNSLNTKHQYDSRDRMMGVSGIFTVIRCRECHQVFLNPQLTKKELSRYYPPTKYYAYNKSAAKGFLQRLREYLAIHYYHPTWISSAISLIVHNVPAIPEKVEYGKVLDVGCGTGDTLVLLKKLGWDVYGMDIDEHALDIAKKRGIAHVRRGFIEDLKKYPDHYFDAIRLYHVIEHLDDPVHALRLLYRKLKKGGELVLGTPNVDSLVARVFGTYWYNLDSPRHLFLFTPKTLRRMVERQNFNVRSIEYCSAGGIAGSLQYWMNQTFNWNLDLIHQLPAVIAFYPLEWILDKCGLGDVFVLRARPKI